MSALHGTAVALDDRAVLLLGKPGSGKSSTALQLMALGAALVSDDGVLIEASSEGLRVRPPANIQGMIEARGVGLISVPFVAQARLAFIVDMDKTAGARLPDPETHRILGVDLPLIFGAGQPNLAAIIWCLLGEGCRLPLSEGELDE